MAKPDLNGSFPASGFRLLALAFCILFGVAYILNVHPVGDGLWFWYAVRVRQGARLYSDMHLSLQPLFVLLTAAFQWMFGLSWLASKILPVLQALAYCWLLYLISSRIPWPDWARGIVLFSVFVLTISGQFYRFDDYHITSDVLAVFCMYMLLRLEEEERPLAVLTCSVWIGLACGICVSNRLNDGATLFVASVAAVGVFARKQKLIALLLLTLATVIGLLAVILLTGDSLQAWATESIVRASRIKGGTGNILLFPFQLPYRLLRGYSNTHAFAGFVWFALLLICAYYCRRFWPFRKQRHAQVVLAGIFITAAGAAFMLRTALRGNVPPGFLSTTVALAVLLAAVLAVVRAALFLLGRRPSDWSPRELLLLIPAAQLLAGAMTSAIVLPNLTPPVAMTLLVLPLVLPVPFARRATWVLVTIYLGASLPALLTKYRHPYYWHHYTDAQMFVSRQWYRHPLYGRMYIEDGNLALMLPMCASIHRGEAPSELLSLPYPYPNYFCGIPPWHNYVQTWYDTSSPETIAQLISELNAAPPTWIAYQHDLDTIAIHEWAFTQRRPLPQRALEQMIVKKLVEGSWAIESRSCLNGSEWMLLRSSAPRTRMELDLQTAFTMQPGGLCAGTIAPVGS